MQRAWLILVALALTTLAGCFGTAPTVSAFSLQSEADTAAMEIDDSAVLAGIVGFEYDNETWGEYFEEEADDDPAFAALARGPDGQIGDGKARAWGYQYSTDDGSWLAVVVDSEGRVLFAGDAEGSELGDAFLGEGGSLGEVLVDSDEAARIVAESNADYARVLGASDAIAFSFLGRFVAGANPVWILGAETDDGGGEDAESVGIVDAVDGTYSTLGSYLEQFLMVPTEHGSFSGVVDLTAPVEHRFALQEDHLFRLGVGVHFSGGAPLGDAELTLTLPNGTALEQSVSVAPGLAQTHAYFLVAAPPEKGAYTLAVALPDGVTATYSATWCAAGFVGFDTFTAIDHCTSSFEDEDPFGSERASSQPNRFHPYAW